MTGQFVRVAQVVTERAAELLGAPVAVSDARGVVVASSRPELLGLPAHRASAAGERDYLRVPLAVDQHKGEIIVGEPSNGQIIAPQLAETLVELMINQTTTARRRPNQRERKDDFLYELLHGQIPDESAILRDAKILGLDFVPPRAVILIDAADFILVAENGQRREAADTQIRRRAQLLIGSVVNFFHLPSDTICAYLGDGQVAVLKASNTKNLATWVDRGESVDQVSSSWANLSALRRAATALLTRLCDDTGAELSIGIGRYHPGVSGLARSYQDARAALSLGRRFHGRNQVHCLDGLGIAAFVGVADEQTKVDLATYLLSPLDLEPDLLETLEAFFQENCSANATAARLSIHRNTLTYRLTKIASLTGLDPRIFEEAVQIRLCLLLRSLSATVA